MKRRIQFTQIRVYQSIVKTVVVDTTAAGDTYLGYFLAGVAQGLPHIECLKMATFAASLAVSKKGASISKPFIKDVEVRRMKELTLL